MTDNYAIYQLSEVVALRNIGEIRESAFVVIPHMHSAIKHHILVAN